MSNLACPTTPVTPMTEMSNESQPPALIRGRTGRLHADRRVTVTYRQHWRAAESAVRAAAAEVVVRGQKVSGDIAVYAFETLRVELRDHRSGLVRTARHGRLSERQMALQLGLPRETMARVLAVLQTATVGGVPMLTRTGTGWVMRTAWMSVKPLHGDRSWLATDRPTWSALRTAVPAHDRDQGGGRLWHKSLGMLVTLRYRFALAESGVLVARHRGTYRELEDADVCRHFGVDAPVWRGRKELLVRAGVLGPVLGGLAFGVRGWDELEGLAGVVDQPGYVPPFHPPAELAPACQSDAESREDPSPATEQQKASAPAGVGAGPVDSSAAVPVDNSCADAGVAHKSGPDTPPSAYKFGWALNRNPTRVGVCLRTTFASRRVQLRFARLTFVDGLAPARAADRARRWAQDRSAASSPLPSGAQVDERSAVTAMVGALCSVPELAAARSAVRASYGIRTLLARMHEAGYGPGEVRHFVFVDTPMPWPAHLSEHPDQAVRVLAWRLRRLLKHRPSRAAAAAARDRERGPLFAAIAADRALALQRHAVHEEHVAVYLGLPDAERERVCQTMRAALGPEWFGRPDARPDDENAIRLVHRVALAAALETVGVQASAVS